MDIVKLERFNEWWTTKKVKTTLLKEYKRPLFSKIENYLKNRQIILLTGLRRVGKTTLMYQLIQNLLDKGVKETEVVYFSFDEESAELDDLFKTYEEKILKKEIGDERVYVFLDEIQKLKNWQNKIKIYYDLYPSFKFVISGSASVKISKKAKENLAGRIYDFLLEPLSFKEFLEWKNISIDTKKAELFQKKIMPLFYDYLRKGGFPEIIFEEDDEKIKNYIKSNIIENIIYKDIPEEFGVKDYELLKTLLEMVATAPGMIINYDKLSKDLKRNKRTIINYFFYLEYSMLFRVVANYREGFLISSRKMKKVYPTNTAISFVFVEDFYSNKFMEKVAENFAVIESNAKNYYRNKCEIDIILKFKKIIPIEIKFGEIETKGIRKFLEEFAIKKAIILTKDVFDRVVFDKKEIIITPLWIFSLSKESYLH